MRWVDRRPADGQPGVQADEGSPVRDLPRHDARGHTGGARGHQDLAQRETRVDTERLVNVKWKLEDEGTLKQLMLGQWRTWKGLLLVSWARG